MRGQLAKVRGQNRSYRTGQGEGTASHRTGRIGLDKVRGQLATEQVV